MGHRILPIGRRMADAPLRPDQRTSIQYQDEDGKPRRAAATRGCMLPWKTPSDEVFVTMCSKLVDNAAAAR